MNMQKEGKVYTPEKMAYFIAKTAIEKFLLEKIKNKFSTEILNLNELFEKSSKNSKGKPELIAIPASRSDRERFEFIFELLNSLKVLDPAVGSGHFIIAALEFLEVCYLNLRNLGIINWSNYRIREYIISNSLFGVDIEIKAIENTKRRLLSTLEDLVSNPKEVKALANINSSFKVGNAIVGFLRESEINIPVCTDLNACFYEEIKNVFETHIELRKIKITENEKKIMVLKLKPFHWFHEFPEIMIKGGFDIIIENPPYISNKQLSPLEKAIYQKRFETPKGLMNIFGIFIERSIELCNLSSRVSIVVHKNIIRSNNYVLLRKYLLERTTIEEIIDLGAGAFQSVTAETVIIILATRPPPEDHKILIKSKLNNHNNFHLKKVILNKVAQKTYLEQENYNFNLELHYEELEIINYIRAIKDCDLSKYFKAKTCIATGDDEKFLADHKINNSYKKTLRGKNIGCYFIDFDGLFVFYDIKALHRARDETIFQKPEKLVMQTISSNLTVAYDNNKYYPLSTCIGIIPKDDLDNCFSIKYLLLLMNSKVMNFYYDFVFNLGAHLTTEISVNNINRLPLKPLKNYEVFNKLADLMIQMNENETARHENKNKIEYLDNLINILIYESIFYTKFQSDGLNTHLINKISPYIKNLNKESIEQSDECIKNLQNDEDVYSEAQYIKKHPWMIIIEEYFKK